MFSPLQVNYDFIHLFILHKKHYYSFITMRLINIVFYFYDQKRVNLNSKEYFKKND